MINGKDQEIITINKTGNSILNNAKYSADNTDEWYTTYETIAEELSHYKNQFIDKVVLCNCDDPFESNYQLAIYQASSAKTRAQKNARLAGVFDRLYALTSVREPGYAGLSPGRDCVAHHDTGAQLGHEYRPGCAC